MNQYAVPGLPAMFPPLMQRRPPSQPSPFVHPKWRSIPLGLVVAACACQTQLADPATESDQTPLPESEAGHSLDTTQTDTSGPSTTSDTEADDTESTETEIEDGSESEDGLETVHDAWCWQLLTPIESIENDDGSTFGHRVVLKGRLAIFSGSYDERTAPAAVVWQRRQGSVAGWGEIYRVSFAPPLRIYGKNVDIAIRDGNAFAMTAAYERSTDFWSGAVAVFARDNADDEFRQVQQIDLGGGQHNPDERSLLSWVGDHLVVANDVAAEVYYGQPGPMERVASLRPPGMELGPLTHLAMNHDSIFIARRGVQQRTPRLAIYRNHGNHDWVHEQSHLSSVFGWSSGFFGLAATDELVALQGQNVDREYEIQAMLPDHEHPGQWQPAGRSVTAESVGDEIRPGIDFAGATLYTMVSDFENSVVALQPDDRTHRVWSRAGEVDMYRGIRAFAADDHYMAVALDDAVGAGVPGVYHICPSGP